MISEIIENNRNISRRISPFHIEKLGLRAAIEDLLEKINRGDRFHITTELAAIENYFPGDWNIQIYRIVQECLTNIMKHTEAKHIGIFAALDKDKLKIRVINDGLKGPAKGEQAGIGRKIMAERAALINANIVNRQTDTSYEVEIAIEH